MGLWKDEALRQESQRYSYNNSLSVCPACTSDPQLAQTIQNAIDVDLSCSYCNKVGAVDLTFLLDEISGALSFDYIDPAEELPYDSCEGGYQGDVYTTREIIDSWDWTSHERLAEDVAAAFGGALWCKRSQYILDEHEGLVYSWSDFCEQIKHKTRYLFFQKQRDFDELSIIHPGKMLASLEDLFKELDLFYELPVDTKLVRARVVPRGERLSTARELGTAPVKCAIIPNRMSPPGIPMFYGAFDAETAVLETYRPDRGGKKDIVFGFFKTLEPMKVLDFTNLPQRPSVFDHKKRPQRLKIAFLHDFEHDLTKPVARDSQSHVEYVPTQVVTEYVRHRMRTPNNEGLDGIIYSSSHSKANAAAVIFAPNEQCDPKNVERDSVKAVLALDAIRYNEANDFHYLWEN